VKPSKRIFFGGEQEFFVPIVDHAVKSQLVQRATLRRQRKRMAVAMASGTARTAIGTVSIYEASRIVEFGDELPSPRSIALPSVISFADTWYVGEDGAGRLIALAKYARRKGRVLQVALKRDSQPFRKLKSLGALGCVVTEDSDGVGLWNLLV
jgi:hypothetical protein